MPPLVALLDACVLAPFAVRNTLLYAAHAGFYAPRWSPDILAELERTLRDDLHLTDDQIAGLFQRMRDAFPTAVVDGYEPLTATLANNPGDRHVLAAAIVSGAPVIVTDNLKDFPPSALRPPVTAVETPDSFLLRFARRDAPATVRFLDQQRRDMTRSSLQGVDDLLAELAPRLPRFVAEVRRRGSDE
jgi:hypothetical protein